ncbi:MAG: 2,3-bisphosphoglycerate-independent phosphoglycerate mutase [Saccharofermentanales bacterium]|jgi:2,3-bisphosphoglycerate-independent phosphoglycerate mutase|nr:2,3-bisphosphoglycerate-independent phosphoglycerate mutase [Bacillota bacterium]NLB08249.1 2,3-bisphosphoglycerate-independent phosphoglycerate mutase [Clostridiales bacterium]
MKNKILLAIADGLGDRPVECLGGKTPLEYAKKPTLDDLAANGSSGIMDLYKLGTPVGTDLGHMLLFGYDYTEYPGRGPIEAFGEGLELEAGDVAFRVNFATVDSELVVVDRRAGRIRKDTDKLALSLNGMQIEDVKVIFKEATEHRAVLILRGPGLSQDISDTDPKVEAVKYKEAKATTPTPEAEKTVRILNQFLLNAHKMLLQHPVNKEREAAGEKPANFILTRGAGIMPNLRKTADDLKIRAACVAAESTVLGAARLAGITPITDPRFTGNIDTDIALKAKTAVDALKENDFVVLHFKATDLMGHDNDPQGKVNAVETFDKMLGFVMEGLSAIEENVIVALGADHSTPCERREHSGDPVPVVISGKNIRKDGITTYDEMAAARGGLNRINANMFFNYLMDYLEATKKVGN